MNSLCRKQSMSERSKIPGEKNCLMVPEQLLLPTKPGEIYSLTDSSTLAKIAAFLKHFNTNQEMVLPGGLI